MSAWPAIVRASAPSLPTHCEPTTPTLHFISSTFHVCIPTYLALLSSTLGCLSIASWLFAQIPQIIKNYHLQSTSGLSVFFLVEWCLGDTTNLLGCLLTQQAQWQVVVASYYVCVDVVLVWQYAWYTYLKPRVRRRHGKGHLADSDDDDSDEMIRTSGEIIQGVEPMHERSRVSRRGLDRDGGRDGQPGDGSSPPSKERESNNTIAMPINNRATFRGDRASPLMPSPRTLMMMSLLVAVVSAHPSSPSPLSSPSTGNPVSTHTEVIGSFFSWSSTLLYLGSRLPQIYKNHTRQSTTGLSAKLFIAAFFGNLFYSTSILTNPCAWSDFPVHGGHGWAGPEGSQRSEWIARAAPFWLGAAGVLGLDATVGVQFWMFGEKGGSREIPVVVVEDERGRHWELVTGWMRGWVPRVRSISARRSSREGELLLGGSGERERRGSYGSV